MFQRGGAQSSTAGRGGGGSSSGAGGRQFRSGMDERESLRTWDSLKRAIHQIHAHNASSLSFEELYRNAYNLVLHKYGDLLYNGVREVIVDHLKSGKMSGSVINSTSDSLLEQLKIVWDDHRTTMVMVRDILMYLDRNFVTQNKKIPVYDLGLISFRDHVLEVDQVRERLLQIMLDSVNKERNGEVIDRLLLRHTVYMLVDLGGGVTGSTTSSTTSQQHGHGAGAGGSSSSSGGDLYKDNCYRSLFEDAFIKASQEFYQHESTKYISENTCADYLRKAETRINEEKNRVQSYLHESSNERLQTVMDQEWILRHYDSLAAGAKAFLEQDKVEDLARMYKLFARCMFTNAGATTSAGGLYGYPAAAPAAGNSNSSASTAAAAGPGGTASSSGTTTTAAASSAAAGGAPPMITGTSGSSSSSSANATKPQFQQSNYFASSAAYTSTGGLDTLKPLQQIMRECIKEQGSAILNPEDSSKSQEPVAFIEALLRLRAKFSAFVRLSFGNSKEFSLALKTSFEETLNADTATAQFLSLFVDDLFKKGLKGADFGKSTAGGSSSSSSGAALAGATGGGGGTSVSTSDMDLEAKLDQVVTIFRYLADKDIFESFYKQFFAKRILNGKHNEEAEKCMISKLKSECGHQYTAKMEGMLNDIKSSDELTRSFHSAHPVTSLGNIELKLSILTSGFWPVSAPANLCEVPRPLQMPMQVFEEYYGNKHQGRKLTWNFAQGTADLRARMPGTTKRHELVVSTYQMVLLYCFNEGNELTFSDLFHRSKIPIEDFRRHLQSLYANPKCRILVKTTGGNPNENNSSHARKEPVEGDTFAVNPEFESKLLRVKVPLIRDNSEKFRNAGADDKAGGMNDGYTGASDMPSSVEEDRKHLTEAVIVRIMKSRKQLDHNSLVVEATKMLSSRFTPAVALIKQRIEKLIEREYLERSADDRKVYKYLA